MRRVSGRKALHIRPRLKKVGRFSCNPWGEASGRDGAYQVSLRKVEPSDAKWGRKLSDCKTVTLISCSGWKGKKNHKLAPSFPLAALLILPSYRRKCFPNSREKGLYIKWYAVHSDSEELPGCAVGPDFPRAEDLRLNIKRFECVGTVKETEPWSRLQKRERSQRQKRQK